MWPGLACCRRLDQSGCTPPLMITFGLCYKKKLQADSPTNENPRGCSCRRKLQAKRLPDDDLHGFQLKEARGSPCRRGCK